MACTLPVLTGRWASACSEACLGFTQRMHRLPQTDEDALFYIRMISRANSFALMP
jgi:hypothetical protein